MLINTEDTSISQLLNITNSNNNNNSNSTNNYNNNNNTHQGSNGIEYSLIPPGTNRLDADALKVNEEIYKHQIGVGLGTGHDIIPPISPSRTGTLSGLRNSRSRSGGSRGGSRSGGSVKSSESRRRGNRSMDRDENESIISSVSTHRSTKSAGIAVVLSGGNNVKYEKKNKKSSAITAENLAILNRLNGDEELKITHPVPNLEIGGIKKSSPPITGERYVTGVNNGAGVDRIPIPRGYSRKTKTNDAKDESWWPKLF